MKGLVDSARPALARLLQEVIVAENRLVASEAARVLDRCAQAIAAARRDGGIMAVLSLDLDGFKRVNGTLGRPAGDEVLKLVAHRLVSTAGDADTVSRQDGDEFVILITRIAHPAEVGRMACDVVTAIGAPARIGDTVLRLTASIGISLYPHDGGECEDLVERAAAAMKRRPRNSVDGIRNFSRTTSNCCWPYSVPGSCKPRRSGHSSASPSSCASLRTSCAIRVRPFASRRPCWASKALKGRCCRWRSPSSKGGRNARRAW